MKWYPHVKSLSIELSLDKRPHCEIFNAQRSYINQTNDLYKINKGKFMQWITYMSSSYKEDYIVEKSNRIYPIIKMFHAMDYIYEFYKIC